MSHDKGVGLGVSHDKGVGLGVSHDHKECHMTRGWGWECHMTAGCCPKGLVSPPCGHHCAAGANQDDDALYRELNQLVGLLPQQHQDTLGAVMRHLYK